MVGLTAGQYYKFRVIAHNVHGWADELSEIASFQAAQKPDQPLAVTTTLSNLNVRIAWTAPNDNFKAITKYEVLIEDTDASGNFVSDVTYCDGTNALILTQDYCDVPVIAALRSDPLNLVQSQLVVAKFRAYNERGWSDYSPANIVGAQV